MPRLELSQKNLEDLVLNLRGRDWFTLRGMERERIVDLCFRYWRKRGFPHYDLSKEEMKEEFLRITETPKERMVLGNLLQMSMIGLKLANHFHPQMWRVQVKGSKAPVDRFNDDEKLRAVILKALKVFPNRLSTNDSNMRRMLKTYSNTACVSNFRPTVAKAIYEYFSGDGDSVLDFSAGYGGRLLGCLSLRRAYTGIDPCYKQILGLKRMVATLDSLVNLNTKANIVFGCAEDVMPSLKSSSVSLIFSSPPYFDLERYSEDNRQSYIRYPLYAEWIEKFLKKIITESYRLLEPGGYFVVNIADINGYRLAEDALRIAKNSFTLSRVLQMRLGNKPYLRAQRKDAYKFEPVFVFRKPHRYPSTGKRSFALAPMTSPD